MRNDGGQALNSASKAALIGLPPVTHSPSDQASFPPSQRRVARQNRLFIMVKLAQKARDNSTGLRKVLATAAVPAAMALAAATANDVKAQDLGPAHTRATASLNVVFNYAADQAPQFNAGLAVGAFANNQITSPFTTLENQPLNGSASVSLKGVDAGFNTHPNTAAVGTVLGTLASGSAEFRFFADTVAGNNFSNTSDTSVLTVGTAVLSDGQPVFNTGTLLVTSPVIVSWNSLLQSTGSCFNFLFNSCTQGNEYSSLSAIGVYAREQSTGEEHAHFPDLFGYGSQNVAGSFVLTPGTWDVFFGATAEARQNANAFGFEAVPSVVPEPATYGLMGLGLLAVGAAARRRDICNASPKNNS
jgi:hypothetical protein